MEVCLYQNLRADVRYVYGAPVKFDTNPDVIKQREADKAAVIAAQKKEKQP